MYVISTLLESVRFSATLRGTAAVVLFRFGASFSRAVLLVLLHLQTGYHLVQRQIFPHKLVEQHSFVLLGH